MQVIPQGGRQSGRRPKTLRWLAERWEVQPDYSGRRPTVPRYYVWEYAVWHPPFGASSPTPLLDGVPTVVDLA